MDLILLLRLTIFIFIYRIDALPTWSGLNHFCSIIKTGEFADGSKYEDMSKVCQIFIFPFKIQVSWPRLGSNFCTLQYFQKVCISSRMSATQASAKLFWTWYVSISQGSYRNNPSERLRGTVGFWESTSHMYYNWFILLLTAYLYIYRNICHLTHLNLGHFQKHIHISICLMIW